MPPLHAAGGAQGRPRRGSPRRPHALEHHGAPVLVALAPPSSKRPLAARGGLLAAAAPLLRQLGTNDGPPSGVSDGLPSVWAVLHEPFETVCANWTHGGNWRRRLACPAASSRLLPQVAVNRPQTTRTASPGAGRRHDAARRAPN